MLVAPKPSDEQDRLAALRSYEILDTAPEQAFDDLTRLASRLCGTPVALVSLVDAERQWFKSRVGLEACETPRSVAFCSHAILNPSETMVVEDARTDLRFADNPLISGPTLVIFYAGVPLVDRDGQALGTLCVVDHKPRTLDEQTLDSLRLLARQVVTQLELRRTCMNLAMAGQELARTNESLRQFTSLAAHDLSEPLQTLIAAGTDVQSHLVDGQNKAAGHEINGMVAEATRLRRLVGDLLVLSRVEFAPVVAEDVDLGECVDLAVGALAAPIRESGAEVQTDPLPHVRGNKTLLIQIFQNLISNAVRFAGDQTPVVQVTCVQEADRVVLGVKDNGVGIPAEHVRRVTLPLQTVGGAGDGRSADSGSGVGLAIVRKAVEYHEGTLSVDTTEGEGTHVTFAFAADRVVVDAPGLPLDPAVG